jgi:hypothetical protein
MYLKIVAACYESLVMLNMLEESPRDGFPYALQQKKMMIPMIFVPTVKSPL